MPVNIIVIDDEPIIADGIEALLSEHFAENALITKTYSATNGFDLLSTNTYDLAICDIEMPVLTGIELKDRIRKLGILTPIIFLTGYNDFNFAYNAIKSQNVFFVLKNESDEFLLNKIGEILQVTPRREILSADELFLKRLDDFINENLLNAINISDIANEFDYNPFYLSRHYKKITGKSLSDHLNEIKLKKCIELITTTDIKIEELAVKMGYSSASSFLAFFKKHTNKTPNQFRRK